MSRFEEEKKTMAAQAVAPPPSPGRTPPLASLYVGDLDPQATEIDLFETFRQMGPLASVRLCRDRLSHQSLRYAYVNFFSPSDASKALACLNHTELKGKPMRIMWRQSNPLTRKTSVGNVFVKNLDPCITSARLQGIFCKFGTILSCKVAEEHGKSKGFGFVQFDSEDSSKTAVNALHGTMLEGKNLYVSKFVKKSERKDAYEEPKFTNLYVKNLGEFVTEDILVEKFSEYGKVRNVLIMKDAEGKSKGFGFVNFESYEEAKKAVEALNGSLLGSEKLFVGRAQKKAEREEFLKREHKLTNSNIEMPKVSNLYVKYLDASVDEGQLEEHFGAFGKVTSAKVMRHESGISKGFGFVNFSTPAEAKRALDALHGTDFKGRDLYVSVAQSKEERQREMQSNTHHPPRAFYPSDSKSYTPILDQAYCGFPPFPTTNQAMMYRQCGRSEGAMYPFMAQGYHRNDSAYIPSRQSQQQTYLDFAYQHPMGYPDSISPTRNLDYRSFRSLQISRDNRSRAEQVYSKGYVGTRSFNPAPHLGNCNQNAGKKLQPLGENLQRGHEAKKTGGVLEMKKSDAHEVLNSSQSPAGHLGKAIQVLGDVNSWTICDDRVAQLHKSARCLGY
ncbi:hypothetical protein C3L33_00214, partial [Rhododendron williamsianum]